MKYINVESDFKLLESFDCNCEVNLKDSEFTFVYYTKQYSDNKVEVSYKDKICSPNCKFTEDNRLIVLFENHNLEPGTLKVKRYFNLNDADFSDKTCDFVIEEELPISLTKGIQPCTEECCYVDVKLPPYYQKGDIGPVGPKGDKGDQGDKGDKGDLTVTGITPHNNLLDNTAFNQYDYEDNLLYWNIGEDAKTEIHGGESGIGNNALLIKSYLGTANTVSPSTECLNGVGYVLSLYTKAYSKDSSLYIYIPKLNRELFYVDGQQGKVTSTGRIHLNQSINWEKHYITFEVSEKSLIYFSTPITANSDVLIAQVKLESNPINSSDDLANLMPTPWTLSANDLKGKDIYELLVESNKFNGTREEFEDEYTDSIIAVKNATEKAITEANKAQEISEQVKQTEEEIRQRDSERDDAFDSAQKARQQTYEDAEDRRDSDYQKAESSRNSDFENEEKKRDNLFLQYERDRESNETLRKKAEEDREKAESDRQALFQSNEESRKNTFNTNESTRQDNEIIRQNNETGRETKEADRQSIFSTNEAERQRIFETNEAIRQAKETSRQDAEVIREENEKRREETYQQKVDREDNAPKLTAGFANNLVGRGEATPQEISFRPSGGDTSIEDGTARIERVKGSTLVWNQYAPVDLSSYLLLRGSDKTYTDGIRTVTSTTANSTSYVYKNASEIIPSRLGRIIYGFAEVKAESTNSEIFIIGAGNNKSIPATGDWQKIETIGKVYVWSGAAIGAGVRVKDEMVTWSIRQLKYYDLTQMFGEGNEPATIEEFHARKPIGIDEYAYNEGELISNNVEELKSVGCNAFNGEYAKVLGGKQYELLGTYTSVGFTKELGGEVAAIDIPSDRMYTPNENGYIYAQGSDICIHLTHTGYKNGRCEEYWAMTRTIPIKDIKDNDGNQLFPNGLLSAGSAHDEITATKAIKRVGVVDLGSLSYTLNAANRYYYSDCFMQANYTDLLNNLACSHYITKHWGGAGGFTLNYAGDRNTCVAIWKGNTTGLSQVNILDDSVADAAELMAMLKEKDVMLYYELAEPIEVDLKEPLNLYYEVSDFGTEEVLSSEPTTPMKADIIYLFNAVDRIRDNSRHTAEADKKLLDYESRIAALEAIAASLTSSES